MVNNSNTNWWNGNNNIQVSTSGDVKVLTTTSSSNHFAPATEPTTDVSKVIYFPPSFACEFDITEISSTIYLQLYDGNVSSNNIAIASTGHWKAVYDGSDYVLYKNGVYQGSKTGYNGNARVNIQCWSSGVTVKFKNFRIYSI